MIPWHTAFIGLLEDEDLSGRDRFLRIKRPGQGGRRSAHELAGDSLPIPREGLDITIVNNWLIDYHHWPNCGSLMVELRYSTRSEDGTDGYISQCTLLPPRQGPTPSPYGSLHAERTHGDAPGGVVPATLTPNHPSFIETLLKAAAGKLVERPELASLWMGNAMQAIAMLPQITPEAVTEGLKQAQLQVAELRTHLEGALAQNQQLQADKAQLQQMNTELIIQLREVRELAALQRQERPSPPGQQPSVETQPELVNQQESVYQPA